MEVHHTLAPLVMWSSLAYKWLHKYLPLINNYIIINKIKIYIAKCDTLTRPMYFYSSLKVQNVVSRWRMPLSGTLSSTGFNHETETSGRQLWVRGKARPRKMTINTGVNPNVTQMLYSDSGQTGWKMADKRHFNTTWLKKSCKDYLRDF